MAGSEDTTNIEGTGVEIAIEDESAKPVKVVDKRRFARLLGFGGQNDDTASETGEVERQLPTYVEELKQRTEIAEARARSEVEAARGRLERYYASQMESARADIALALLEVFDNLERALEAPGATESSLYAGVSATRDIFLRKLEEMGVSAIESEGRPFDPERHEAVDEVEVSDAALDGSVVQELQRGFMIGGRLVRPAIVRVGRFHGAAVSKECGGEGQ